LQHVAAFRAERPTIPLYQAALFAKLVPAKDSNMMAPLGLGCSVFLVEDEVMIRMMVADMLEELGYTIAGEAGEISQAIRLAQSTEFELAILDVNVNGHMITPVAELIKARNLPFIFATGYGAAGVPREYRDRPTLQKPFLIEKLAEMIDRTLDVSAAKN
jgi:DNA-binding NtrC family response regulator